MLHEIITLPLLRRNRPIGVGGTKKEDYSSSLQLFLLVQVVGEGSNFPTGVSLFECPLVTVICLRRADVDTARRRRRLFI